MTVPIYHTPRCSKSRQTLQLLRDKGVALNIVEYLKAPPSASEIKNILGMLKMSPRELLRKKEAPYGELGLADESLSEPELIEAMRADPVLIERPIVVSDGKAGLGRPPENALTLF